MYITTLVRKLVRIENVVYFFSSPIKAQEQIAFRFQRQDISRVHAHNSVCLVSVLY